MLIDDYDLLSSPINYISYQVRSTDGKEHNVQMMIAATPEMALNKANQPTRSKLLENVWGNQQYVCTGTIDQPILAKKGDGICIDWGYFYIPAINGTVSLGNANEMKEAFVSTGSTSTNTNTIYDSSKASNMP